MAQPGILSWVTSIRTTMANDPCRRSLEDRIQTHGFLFLDDYLDNILAQAKRDPLIELVKTPGRKKDAPKRTRATAAAAVKAKSVIAMSLEEKDLSKENQAPVNSFHQALLQAKSHHDYISDVIPLHQSSENLAEVFHSKPAKLKTTEKLKAVTIVEDMLEESEDEQIVEEILSSSPPPSPARLPAQEVAMDFLAPPRIDQPNDLSVIAEDDESVDHSLQLSRSKPATSPATNPSVTIRSESRNSPSAQEEQPENELPTHELLMEINNDDITQTTTTISSSSNQTFHTVSLDSPETDRLQRPNSNFEHLTAPLPQLPQSHSGPIYPSLDGVLAAPPPTITPSASAPNVGLVSVKDPPSVYPSLPAPSPLRKSMRVQREPSMGMSSVPSLPATANAAAGTGKRTSWLAKAREIKAMEVPGKRVSALGAGVSAPGISAGVKRKSGQMLSIAVPGVADTVTSEEKERKHKLIKTGDGDVVVSKEKSADLDKGEEKERDIHQRQLLLSPVPPLIEPRFSQTAFPTKSPETKIAPTSVEDSHEGMVDRFKRTVEGLGARVGKSMNKSLGGPAAAAALAEARAAKVAAEARIAERDGRTAIPISTQEIVVAVEQVIPIPAVAPKPMVEPIPERQKKLSVSDLVTAYDGIGKSKLKEKPKEVEKGFKPVRASTLDRNHLGDESTSTTPPNSPPPTRTSNSSFVLPSGPVFNKPPVFVPPAPLVQPKDLSFKPPPPAFGLPSTSSLDVPAHVPSPASQGSTPALSAQSTQASLFSDAVFDSQSDIPAWMPSTQDTEYSTRLDSQNQSSQKLDDLDEDDSWPMVDEKLSAANPAWTPFGFAEEDSMTWSTLPAESQQGDTRSTQNATNNAGDLNESLVKNATEAFDIDTDGPSDVEPDFRESELEELGLEAGKSTVSLVKSKVPERSQSQMSMASTSSSQSQTGWVGQATKLVSSVLGGSKSKKPQVPSLQRAAAAAKKEQEEKDKKAARMKEMENRRQLALQRKADEEKSRLIEEEKKIKEEGERRKREREENTDKRPLKAGPKKVDEDTTKKRKIIVETEKKPIDSKKPSSKDKKDNAAPSRMPQPMNTSTTAKPGNLNKSGFKPSGSNPALSSSAAYNTQVAGGSASIVKLAETRTAKASASTTSTTTSVKGKAKAKVNILDDDISQPSHQLQSQMAARAKAQIQAAKQQLEAESIELPDINSEYSDSEDEDRPKTFDPPDWAQSPELRQQLQLQSTVNPDEIFGPIKPLRMEEVFRTRQSRFRARTSSANWTGSDRLTIEEEKEYARRMGFRTG